MYSPIKPTDKRIRKFIAVQRRRSFSYPEIGSTKDALPTDYTVDHNRIQLGLGQETFEQAKTAIKRATRKYARRQRTYLRHQFSDLLPMDRIVNIEHPDACPVARVESFLQLQTAERRS